MYLPGNSRDMCNSRDTNLPGNSRVTYLPGNRTAVTTLVHQYVHLQHAWYQPVFLLDRV
jgi:hypothetical protein